MANGYVCERELKEIFDKYFSKSTGELFHEWLDGVIESNEVEIIEHTHFDISQLDFKPTCKMIGENGNVYNLIGLASKILQYYGKTDKAEEMQKRVFNCRSYAEALCILGDYVEII